MTTQVRSVVWGENGRASGGKTAVLLRALGFLRRNRGVNLAESSLLIVPVVAVESRKKIGNTVAANPAMSTIDADGMRHRSLSNKMLGRIVGPVFIEGSETGARA